MINNNGNVYDFNMPIEYLKYVTIQAGLGGMITLKTAR